MRDLSNPAKVIKQAFKYLYLVTKVYIVCRNWFLLITKWISEIGLIMNYWSMYKCKHTNLLLLFVWFTKYCSLIFFDRSCLWHVQCRQWLLIDRIDIHATDELIWFEKREEHYIINVHYTGIKVFVLLNTIIYTFNFPG